MFLALSVARSVARPASSAFAAWSFTPSLNGSSLPGTNVLHNLTDGLGSWALIAAIVGIVIGAVMWAFGHYSHNYQQAYNGRRGVIVSCLAAILIGGASQIVSALLKTGYTIH